MDSLLKVIFGVVESTLNREQYREFIGLELVKPTKKLWSTECEVEVLDLVANKSTTSDRPTDLAREVIYFITTSIVPFDSSILIGDIGNSKATIVTCMLMEVPDLVCVGPHVTPMKWYVQQDFNLRPLA